MIRDYNESVYAYGWDRHLYVSMYLKIITCSAINKYNCYVAVTVNAGGPNAVLPNLHLADLYKTCLKYARYGQIRVCA